jgi:hypothetical protein
MNPYRLNRLRAKLSALQTLREDSPPVVLIEPDDDDPPDVWEAHRRELAHADATGQRVVLIEIVGPPLTLCDY